MAHIWLAGSKEEVGQSLPDLGQSSIAHETIEALRKIGLLDEIIGKRSLPPEIGR